MEGSQFEMDSVIPRKIEDQEIERTLMQEVLKQMPAGVVVAEAPSGRTVMLNEQVEKILKESYVPTECIEDYCKFKYYHPDGTPYRLEDQPMVRSILHGEVIASEEVHLRPENGSHRILSISCAPIFDRGGRRIAAVSTFYEITERKLAEEALIEARDKLQALINASPQAILSLDREGYITSWNSTAEFIFGWARREVLGQKLPIVPADRAPEFMSLRDRVLRGEIFRDIELQWLRKDGSFIDVSLSVAPLRSSLNEIIGIMAVIEDTTEQKRMKDQILFQASLLDQVRNAIIATDGAGRIIYWNTFAESLYQWKADEVMSKSISSVILPPEARRTFEEATSEIKLMSNEEGVLVVRRKNGSTFPAYMVNSVIRDRDGALKGYVGVSVDITELTKLKEELRDSYIKLENAFDELKETDEMKSEFISTASHELRTPLTVISSYLEMFEYNLLGDLDDQQREKLLVIRSQTDQMIKLVEDMLDASRLESKRFKAQMHPVRLEDVARSVVDELSRLAGLKEQKISLEVTDTLPMAKGDEQMIKQVFNNILTNAIKYTPPKGRIEVLLRRDGEQVLASISDTGMGIPEKYHEKVFEKFFMVVESASSLTRETGRMGLGLAIAKGIVEAHSGRIWVESEPGQGSTFYFTIPVDS
ncbi:MAG TPA: PAS domain S-box protein [Methanotrichaceae archaeon]|nr:PAS domain S-box protein [Methanotrichaceae archaeon]